MAETHPNVLERLLQETDWFRRMAYGLVHRDDVAEDVIQQTWLTALQSPPRTARSPRAWLAVVARRAVSRMSRSERRRSARERSVVPGEAAGTAPDPAALAERVDLQRRVAEAVLTLDEPYRSTIVMRYFEDRTPAEIAASLSIPAATVRTRLKRALATLRARLDTESPGDRDSWVASLLPLAVRYAAGPAGASGGVTGTLLTGGLLVSTKIWIGAAVVVALAAAFALTRPPPASSDPEPPDVTIVADDSTPSQDEPGSEAPAEPTPESDPVPAPEEEVVREATAIRGRVVDEQGKPLERARIYVAVPGEQFLAMAHSDEDGRFLLVAPRHETELDFVVDAAGHLPLILSLGTLLDRGEEETVIRLERGLSIEGTVVDDIGAPVKTSVNAVRIGVERGPFSRYSRQFPDRFKTLGFSDESGHFEIGGLAPGEYRIEKATLNYRAGEGSMVTCRAGARGVRLVLYRAVALTLVMVRAGSETPVDEVVAWTLRYEDGEERSGQAGSGRPVVRGLRAGKYRLTVRAPNHEPFETEFELRLDESAASVTVPLTRTAEHGFGAVQGTIVRPESEGAENAMYWIFSPELNGFTGVTAGGDGRFEMPRLPVGVYRIRALSRDGEWATRHERVDVAKDGRAEVVLRAEPAGPVHLCASGHKDCVESKIEFRVFVEDGLLAHRLTVPRGDGGFPLLDEERTLAIVAPGPVKILAVARGRIIGEGSTVVSAGRAAKVFIPLLPSADGAPAAPGEAAKIPPPAVNRPPSPPPPPAPPETADESADVAELIAKLADADSRVRGEAVKALGKLGREECVRPLLHVLQNDGDGFVRRMAIRSLGQLGRKALEAVPTVAQLLRDEDFFVSGAAARAIAAITGKALPYQAGMTEEQIADLVEKHLAEIDEDGGR